ncbi:MAG TPA: sugar transferase [Cytophagaceae bacterium]|nr:sugar transferase [Cytophagaceae bacterium]
MYLESIVFLCNLSGQNNKKGETKAAFASIDFPEMLVLKLNDILKRKFHLYRFVAFDFIAAVIAWILFYIFRKMLLGESKEAINFTLLENAFLIGFFWMTLYYFFGFYSEIYRKSRIKEFFTVFAVSLVGAIVIFFTLLLDDQGIYNYTAYYKTFITYFSIHFFITIFLKTALITFVKIQVREKKIYFNTLIIGSGKKAVDIFNEINKSYDTLGLKFIAYLSLAEDRQQFGNKLRYLGNIENLSKVISRCHIEQIVIAMENEDHPDIQDILFKLENFKNVRLSIIPDIHQYLIGSIRVNHVFDIPLLDINQDLIPEWQANLKRISDVFFASIILSFGMPFFILIGIIIKLGSKGPVLFKQERIGKDGLPFFIYKFRSMYIDAEKNGPALSKENDSRITPFGKFLRKSRIDEFPQFYNVFIGDMSLVGPRPERQFFIDQIIKVAPHYKHLNKVRPGITSLGQVKFGYAQNVEEMVERLKYDILYIENISFAMDLRILLYTILVMIQGRGK